MPLRPTIPDPTPAGPRPPLDDGDAAPARRPDWAATPLGPVETWPPRLRAAADACLDAAGPAVLWWGPDRIQLHNAAFAALAGDGADAALGRPAEPRWRSLLERVAPDVATAGDAPLRIDDARGDARWFVPAPIPVRDDLDATRGVLVLLAEVTGLVSAERAAGARLAERDREIGRLHDGDAPLRAREDRLRSSEERLRFLAALGEATQDLLDAPDILATITRALGERLGADRCYYALIDADQSSAEIGGQWQRDPAMPALPVRAHRVHFCDARFRSFDAGLPFVVDDIDRDERVAAERESYHRVRAIANLSVPLRQDHALVAVIGVHQHAPRRWTDDDVRLVREVAARSWETLRRARSQRALLESEMRLRLATEAVGLGLFDRRLETDEAWCSARVRELFGLAPDEPATGGRLDASIHPEDRARHARAFAAAVDPSGDGLYACEYRVPGPGGVRWLGMTARVSFEPAADGRPVPARLTGVVLDVTEHRRLVEALEEADRRKDEFLAMLAHELRNPLAPMRTVLAVLGREALSAGGRRGLEMGHRQLRQLTLLVDDLLDVARVTRGRIELRPEPVALQRIVGEVADDHGPALRERGQRLVLRMPEAPVVVVADAVRLAQIVENLLSNAIKYGEPGGRVEVCVRDEGDAVSVAVEDDGIGIAPEQLSRVFELFTQIDTAIDRSRGGLGIGLALVRTLVELHGGTIAARSEGVGRGAAFVVRLPRDGPARRADDALPGPGR